MLKFTWVLLLLTKAVTQKCSVKKVFLEILQNSQENTYVRVSLLVKMKAASTENINVWRGGPIAS